MKTKVFIISIALFMLTAVYATSQQNNTNKSDYASGYFKKSPNYIDQNKDGVCDNWKSSKKSQSRKGLNYVDKNNDGVCDNRKNTNASFCCGRGNGYGNGQGNGCMHRHGWKNGKCNNNMQKK
jgi:hypothetical protein